MEQKHQSQGVFNGIVKSQQGAAAGQGCGEWQAHVGGQAGGRLKVSRRVCRSPPNQGKRGLNGAGGIFN